jgi:hypothetical protein
VRGAQPDQGIIPSSLFFSNQLVPDTPDLRFFWVPDPTDEISHNTAKQRNHKRNVFIIYLSLLLHFSLFYVPKYMFL